MYKKYCLIASILLIIPLFTTAMEVDEGVEAKEQKWIYIQTSDDATFVFSSDSQLLSQAKFFRPITEGGFLEKGTADNPIILQSIDSKQLLLIHKFIIIKTDSEKLKRYLKTLNINDLNQLIVANDFLDVKGVLELTVPYFVKQLQEPNVLNTWLQAGGNELLGENKELSDHMKHHIANKIRPTPQYLREKKPKLFNVIKGHKKKVMSIAFDHNGKTLASGSTDNTVKLWDVKTGNQRRTFKNIIGLKSIVFNPNGIMLALVLKYPDIKFWDIKKGAEIRNFTKHKYSLHREYGSVALSSDGTMIALGLSGNKFKIWNLETDKKIHTLIGHNAWPLSVAFNPDGTMLASGSSRGTIKFWNLETGKEIHTPTEHEGWIRSVAFSPDNTILASGSSRSTIKLWNVKTGTEIRSFTVYTHTVYSVAFSPDGTILASGLEDGRIFLWCLIDLEEIKKLSIFELLLIHAWQHIEIINLKTYSELNTIYNQASDLAKTLIPQQEKTWWQYLLP